jgi:hypothetical protein
LTITRFLAAEALPVAVRNRAHFYLDAGMPMIYNALIGLSRELKHSVEGITIDG